MQAHAEPHTPNPIDLHVGARIRMRRRTLGHSQERLAEALGLTFQQVQKYERGANRISASKLYEAASFLKADVNYFYQGYGEAETVTTVHEAEAAVSSFLLTTDGISLAQAFPRIQSAALRRRVLALVEELAKDDELDTLISHKVDQWSGCADLAAA